MADEEADTNFEDRWADVPADETTDEDTKKKLELLKLISPPEPPVPTPGVELNVPPPPPPLVDVPARTPAPPVDIMPQGMFGRLFPAPKFLPGAPLAQLPPAPPTGAVPPPPVSPQGEAPTTEQVQELERLLSKDEPLPAELQRGDVGPSKDVATSKKTSLEALREPLKKEIEGNPKLKLRLAALLSLENEGAGPAVIESLLNRALYAGRSVESMSSLGPNSFYGPGRIPGRVEARMQQIESNPKYKNWLFGKIDEAYKSNVTKGHTDQGSAGDPNYIAGGSGVNINGERFNDWGGGPGGHAGARAFRAQLMKLAGEAGIPAADVAGFLGGKPMAEQKAELTGGYPTTGAQAAQTAALMTGTPVEKIQAIVDKMNTAAAKGIVERKAPMAARPVKGIPAVEQPQGQLPQEGSVTHTSPDMLPVPGYIPPRSPITDLTNPSVMSSILAHQALTAPPAAPVQPSVAPPPMPQSPSELMRFMKNAASIAPPAAVTNPIGAIKALVDNFRQAKEVYDQASVENAANVGKGIVSGVAQQPTGAFNMFVTLPAAAAGLLTGSDTLKGFAADSLQRSEEWRRTVNDALGLKEGATGGGTGEVIGQNLAPSGSSFLVSMARTGIQEAASPYIHKLAQAYPIPSVVSPASAAPIKINTPGGDVVMNDAQLSEFVYGGALMMGVGLTPAALARGSRVAREWSSTLRDRWIDPRREVTGAPGTIAASMPRDLLKGTIVDTPQAMLDVIDRHARFEKPTSGFWDIVMGRDKGIDPVAAQEVKEKFHIQTRSGANHLVNQALSNGQLSTRDFRFDVKTPLAKIDQFAQANPVFGDYLKLKMISEQLEYNNVQYQKLSPQAKKTSNIARSYSDSDGNIWTRQGVPGSFSAKNEVAKIEAANPQFAKVYGDLRENIQETQRFITLNPNNVENAQAIMDRTIHQPTFPIFSANTKTDKMMTRILNGENPLRVVEDHMAGALHKQMKNDADLTYVGIAPASAFTERTEKWVKTRGAQAIQEGAVLKRKVDGEYKYYTADPFLVSALNSGDVPAMTLGSFVSGSKRLFTSTTTGSFAPWFAPVAGHRAMWQGMVTMPRDIKLPNGRVVPAPKYIASGIGALRQALPQYAALYAPTIAFWKERIANSVVGKMLPMDTHSTFAATLEKYYNDSFYKTMAEHGGISGGAIIDAIDSHSKITQLRLQHGNGPAAPMLQYLQNAAEMGKRFFWEPLKFAGKNIEIARQSIADAPQFAYAHRISQAGVTRHGQSLHPSEVASIMRNYTGDPSVRGTPYSRDISGKIEPFRFQARNAVEEGVVNAARGVSHTMDFARAITPWAGVLVQSPAATWKALKDNPIRANMAFAVTGAMPEAVAYLWNMSQNGPDGKPTQEYIDYMMNGRSDYNTMNNIYIAIPGKKPWEGIEAPMIQENLPVRALMRGFMNQWAGRSPQTFIDLPIEAGKTTLGGGAVPYPKLTKSDLADALGGFLGTMTPPPPPALGALAASKGTVLTGGYTGELYTRKANQFEPGTKESNLELTIRQLAPGIADIFLQSVHAFMDAPSATEGVAAAAKQGGQRILSKTPFVRDFSTHVIGHSANPPVSGSPAVNQRLFELDRQIGDLDKRYNTWEGKKGQISMKGPGVSPSGMSFVEGYVPEPPPMGDKGVMHAGLTPDEPKNPLYKEFMTQMEEQFKKDNPDKGGIGYRSLWKHYSMWSQEVKRLNSVNYGNSYAWVQEQNSKPEMLDYLKKNGVNPYDFFAVKNFMNYNRGKVGGVILNTISAVEQKFNNDPRVQQFMKGKKFTFDMLDPDKEGLSED